MAVTEQPLPGCWEQADGRASLRPPALEGQPEPMVAETAIQFPDNLSGPQDDHRVNPAGLRPVL